MAIRSQPPQQYARAPSRASDLELELKTLQERRAVLELERERLNVGAQEKQLLESQARSRKLAELFEDSPYPSEADGVDYDQVASAKQLFESRALYEAYGSYDYLDLIGPGGYASTWGQPLGYGMQAYLNPLSTRVDRAQGRDRPFVITEVDLGFIRGIARIVCEINCPAKGAIRSLVNYTVGGRGFQYTVATKNQQRKPPDGLIEAVQEVVDEFLERVKWCGALGKEGELVRRWFRDGEYFLQAHCDRVGRTDLRFVEPEQITELGAQHWNRESMAEYGLEIGEADVDITFGVLTPKHDVNVRWGYNAWYDDLGECELLPADTLQHFKISDTNIKRGISDFYGAVKWLQRSDNLLTKTAGGAAIQAAIAGIRKHAAGVTQSDVSAFRASKTDYTTTAYMPGGGTRQFNNYAYPDGTILDIPFGLDWDQPPQGADRGPAFVEVAQAMLRWVATQWSMPEFLISSDASNANYSSTMVAESPFVKNIEGLQFGFGAMWHDLLWRVIYNAARYGRFDRFSEAGGYYAIRKLLKLHISFPTIETRDRNQETQRLKTLSDDGVISLETRAAEEGFDLAEEQAKGAKQRPAEITAKADGMDAGGGVTSLAGTEQGKGKPGQPGQPKPEQPAGNPDVKGEQAQGGPSPGGQQPAPQVPSLQNSPTKQETLHKSVPFQHESAPLFESGAEHAPKGGATIGGKKFEGGQFIPAKDMAKATPAEKHALKAKQEADKADHAVTQEQQAKAPSREPKYQQKLPGIPNEDDRGNKLLFKGAPVHRGQPDVNAIAMKERAAKIGSGGAGTESPAKPKPDAKAIHGWLNWKERAIDPNATEQARRAARFHMRDYEQRYDFSPLKGGKPKPTASALMFYTNDLNTLRDPSARPEARQAAVRRLGQLEDRFDFSGLDAGKDATGNRLLFKGGPIARSEEIPEDDRKRYEQAWEVSHSFINNDYGVDATENQREQARAVLNEIHEKYPDQADALNQVMTWRKNGPTPEAENQYRDLYVKEQRGEGSDEDRSRLDELDKIYGSEAFDDVRSDVDDAIKKENTPDEGQRDMYRDAYKNAVINGGWSATLRDLEQRYGDDAFQDIRDEVDDMAANGELEPPEGVHSQFGEGEMDSEQEEEARSKAEQEFGDKDTEFFADISGLTKETAGRETPVVDVSDVHKWHPRYSDDYPIDAVGQDITISHPYLEDCREFVGVDKDGKKMMQVGLVVVRRPPAPPGFGAQMFGAQVEEAKRQGLDYITLHAAGGKNTRMNGYYTWPRFGFDQDIETLEPGLRIKVARQFPNANSVLDVFASPGGAEWWKENGGDMHNARFDLHDGSRSLQVWKAYQEAKKQVQSHVAGGGSNAV